MQVANPGTPVLRVRLRARIPSWASAMLGPPEQRLRLHRRPPARRHASLEAQQDISYADALEGGMVGGQDLLRVHHQAECVRCSGPRFCGALRGTAGLCTNVWCGT